MRQLTEIGKDLFNALPSLCAAIERHETFFLGEIVSFRFRDFLGEFIGFVADEPNQERIFGRLTELDDDSLGFGDRVLRGEDDEQGRLRWGNQIYGRSEIDDNEDGVGVAVLRSG